MSICPHPPVVNKAKTLTAADADKDDETGNTWIYTFEGLTAYEKGKQIDYSVEETKTTVITGTDGPGTYAVAVQGSAEDGFEITNTHTPEVRDITVTKAWKDYDNMNSTRPDTITVQLYAGGTAYGDPVAEVALSEENSWKHVFENLDVNKVVDGKGGNAIVYTVEEEKVNGYFGETVKTEEADGVAYTFTNTYAPARHDPPVKKVITGDKPGEAETFYFTITPVSNTAGVEEMPMPDGAGGNSKTVEIKGEGEVEFGIITFNVPGQYIYQVVETAGSNSSYTYDASTYQIIYDVTEGEDSLQASRRYLKDGKEVEEIVFTNEYKEPTKPSEPSEPNKPTKRTVSNNTGDSANGVLWAMLLLLAGGALVGTVWYRRRKKI